MSERLNISVDLVADCAMGAIWIPHPGETTLRKNDVLEHFKNATFSKKTVGSSKNSHFSRDEIYTDTEHGISFYLNTFHKTVQHIAFTPPIMNRRLSTE